MRNNRKLLFRNTNVIVNINIVYRELFITKAETVSTRSRINAGCCPTLGSYLFEWVFPHIILIADALVQGTCHSNDNDFILCISCQASEAHVTNYAGHILVAARRQETEVLPSLAFHQETEAGPGGPVDSTDDTRVRRHLWT